MATSVKHTKFIQLVANGETQTKAYELTCGNKKVTNSVSRVKGSQLAKRYANEITKERNKLQKAIRDLNKSDAVTIALNAILTQSEVDAKLCKILNGELIDVQVMDSLGRPKAIAITPTIGQQLDAIETYNKRFGSNLPAKLDIMSDGKKIEGTIINLGSGIAPINEATK